VDVLTRSRRKRSCGAAHAWQTPFRKQSVFLRYSEEYIVFKYRREDAIFNTRYSFVSVWGGSRSLLRKNFMSGGLFHKRDVFIAVVVVTAIFVGL